MAARSAIADGDRAYRDMRFFFCDAPSAGHAERDGMVVHSCNHYDGPLSEANVYLVAEGWTLERVRTLLGCGALSPIAPISKVVVYGKPSHLFEAYERVRGSRRARSDGA